MGDRAVRTMAGDGGTHPSVTNSRAALQQAVVHANQAAATTIARTAGAAQAGATAGLAALETAEDALDRATLEDIATAEQQAIDAVEVEAAKVSDAKRKESLRKTGRFARGAAGLGLALVVVSWARALWWSEGLPWEVPTALTVVVVGLVVLGSLLSGQEGVLAVLVGADGRLSTSRTAAAVWTVTLCFALLSFAFAGADPAEFELDENYLLLLGGPFAAWVLTGSVTRTKIAKGQLQKTRAVETQPVRDLVSDDDGELSLTDLQYLAFGLVALVSFYWTFLSTPAPTTMPTLPDGLVLLTSAGALAYLGNKAVVANAPFISAVLPPAGRTQVRAGRRVVVTGGNFVPPGAGGDLDSLAGVRVRVRGGEHERIVAVIPRMRTAPRAGAPEQPTQVRREATNPTATRLHVRMPIDLSGLVDVSVVTLAGAETPAFPVYVEPAAEVASRQGAEPATVGAERVTTSETSSTTDTEPTAQKEQ